MRSGAGDGTSLPPGFPIRKSPDHSSVASSPGHIAGSHVLHRLLVPRHPPCALDHLTMPTYKPHVRHHYLMLASTMHVSTTTRDDRPGRPTEDRSVPQRHDDHRTAARPTRRASHEDARTGRHRAGSMTEDPTACRNTARRRSTLCAAPPGPAVGPRLSSGSAP